MRDVMRKENALGEHKVTVDSYIALSPPFAQPILGHLRDLIHNTCPDTRESIKWAMPFFLHGNAMLCNMAAFRTHCSFGFWDRRMTPLLAERGVLCGNAMGSMGRIRSVEDLPDDAVMSELMARALAFAREEGRGRVGVARLELEPPTDLLEALGATTGAKESFFALSPSCRREYVEWVLGAKRDETRTRRVAEAVARITEGKTRSSEYETRMRQSRGA